MEIAGTVILSATVGSTAYGLAREGSDVDTLGIYVAPTRDFWRLSPPAETYHNTASNGAEFDYTYHEIAKYVGLALKCNPTIVELLWLPSDLIQVETMHARFLRTIRESFLSTNAVRSAYGGYAKQQIERLIRRNAEGRDGFSSDTKKRTAKHARHCFRLIAQGQELLETGALTVRVQNPDRYWAFDNMSVEEMVAEFAAADAVFQSVESVLPDKPDRETVERVLMEIREDFLYDRPHLDGYEAVLR